MSSPTSISDNLVISPPNATSYLIAYWDDVEHTYKVLSYSHRYDDLCSQFVKFRRAFPNCIIFINMRDVHAEEMRIKYNVCKAEILEALKIAKTN